MKTTILSILVISMAAAACKGSDVPAKPANGAPLALEQKSLEPGGALVAKAYNFSDKTIVGYSLKLRYYDASGKYIEPQFKGPFDYEGPSFSGNKYKCAPKSWCELEVDDHVPATAAKAVMFAEELRALSSDGVKIEQAPLFEDTSHKWPIADGATPVAKS